MISIRAEGLGKAYRVYKRPFDSLKELLLRRDYSETFWALHDVTFEVVRGSSLGIIGDNGAGKSTLLKLLAGATTPTTGRVERVGRVAAMLSLGAGFHPDLSGLDNIRIGCAVLGLSPADTDALTPAIVEFSELGTFVSRPVRTYSSGMNLRLGFSVATAVNPDILVVDEHLSVGDQHFRHKCLRRIMALRESGCTLVFCSHDLYSVKDVCDRTLWLRDGGPAMLAATPQVLHAYEDHVRARNADTTTVVRAEQPAPAEREHPAENYLSSITLVGRDPDAPLLTGDTLAVRIVARIADGVEREGVHIVVLIVRNDAVWCYGSATSSETRSVPLFRLPDGSYGVMFVAEHMSLLSGQYTFTIALMDSKTPHVYDYVTGAAPFTVRHDTKEVGIMRLPHEWRDPRES